MSRKPRHGHKPKATAWTLALIAVVMVLGAVGAVFLPADGKTTAGPSLIPPPITSSSSPSPTPCCPSHSPTPAPAQPVAYPAPSRTYPAPTTTYPPPPPSPTPPPGSDLATPAPLTPPLQGVVTPDVAAWDTMTNSHALLVTSYVSIARPLAPTFIHSVLRTAGDATPVIEITLNGPPLTLEQVAAGQADPWLMAMRAQIDAMGRPVVLSFAPEPNGKWYSWGLDPAGFTAAWRHVHQVIGTAGVTWMWQPSAHNLGDPATQDIGAYWPGTGEADWIGLDGYYYVPGDSFEGRFAHSLAEVATWWTGPVIIAETAVSPATKNMPDDIADLFAGVARHHLLGLIYFNLKPVCPPECGFYHPDFRLENYPAALAAYSKAVHGSW